MDTLGDALIILQVVLAVLFLWNVGLLATRRLAASRRQARSHAADLH